MELELEYENEADIPKGYEALYTEKDGKWTFTAIKMPKGGGASAEATKTIEKLRKDLKEANVKLTAFKGLDPDTIHDDIAELEELRISASGTPDSKKVAELVDAQVARKTNKLQRDLDKANEELAELRTEAENLRTEKRVGTLKEHGRSAATKLKVVPEAIDDVLLYAERLFEVGEDGVPVARDGVGVTPGISIDDWLADQQKAKPHWFPRSQGGGSKGSMGGGAAPNPWRKDQWSITAQGKYLQEHGPEKAAAAAAAAGSKVGATAPPAN